MKIGKLDMAEELYNEMIGFDANPYVFVYGVLIIVSADAESVKEALGYIDAMKRAGLPRNIFTHILQIV